MIKWGLQTLIPKISSKRFTDFSGWHEDHHLPPIGNRNTAQLCYDASPLTGKDLPAEKRDVGSIYSADKNSSIAHSERSQNSLLHFLPGCGCECENRG